MDDVVEYTLRLGDDALVLAQRLGEWSSRAPELEIDVALTNIGLDLLGQARTLLSHAGEVEGEGRDEDDLAYLRDEREFLNCQLVEQPNGDFAETIARQLFFATYQSLLYVDLLRSRDDTLAAVAAKAVKEVAYHCEYSADWVVRLGDGTAESRRRMQRAVAMLWPYTFELFESDDLVERLVARGVAADVASRRTDFEQRVGAVLREATLDPVGDDGWRPTGGRQGIHTETMGPMLAELQYLHRSHPGATW